MQDRLLKEMANKYTELEMRKMDVAEFSIVRMRNVLPRVVDKQLPKPVTGKKGSRWSDSARRRRRTSVNLSMAARRDDALRGMVIPRLETMQQKSLARFCVIYSWGITEPGQHRPMLTNRPLPATKVPGKGEHRVIKLSEMEEYHWSSGSRKDARKGMIVSPVDQKGTREDSSDLSQRVSDLSREGK